MMKLNVKIPKFIRTFYWIRFGDKDDCTIIDWARWNHLIGRIYIRETPIQKFKRLREIRKTVDGFEKIKYRDL